MQGFSVTCLFTGQYNTKGYGLITDVILVGSKYCSSNTIMSDISANCDTWIAREAQAGQGTKDMETCNIYST